MNNPTAFVHDELVRESRRRGYQRYIRWLACYLASTSATYCLAQVEATFADRSESETIAGVQIETVTADLNQPWDLAVRPGGSPDQYEVFVAEAGRIARLESNNLGDSPQTIIDLSEDAAAADPTLIHDNPCCIGVVDPQTLIVAKRTTSASAGSLLVYQLSADRSGGYQRVATLPINIHATHVREAAADGHVGPLRLAVGHGILYVSTPAEGGGVLQTPLRGTIPEALRTLFRLSSLPRSNLPLAMTVNHSAEKPYLLFSQVRETSENEAAKRCLLTFLNPFDARQLLGLSVDLPDIVDLEYSPATGLLYAVTLGENNPRRGGVFRLDAALAGRRAACRAVPIADVERSTALAFAPDGSLYVTCLGESSEQIHGKLLRITGKL